MAEKNNKHEGNVDGKFFVDKNCIACDACCTHAPSNFKMNEDDGHAYVGKQPENEVEEKECEQALEACPVSAIGNDG